jgi:hypothetical protein
MRTLVLSILFIMAGNCYATISGALKVYDYRDAKNGAFKSFTSKSGKDLRQIYNYMNEFKEIERDYFRLNDTAMILDEKIRDRDNLNNAGNLQSSLAKLKLKNCNNDLTIELTVQIKSKQTNKLSLFIKTGDFKKQYPAKLKKDNSINIQATINKNMKLIAKDLEAYVNKTTCLKTAAL